MNEKIENVLRNRIPHGWELIREHVYERVYPNGSRIEMHWFDKNKNTSHIIVEVFPRYGDDFEFRYNVRKEQTKSKILSLMKMWNPKPKTSITKWINKWRKFDSKIPSLGFSGDLKRQYSKQHLMRIRKSLIESYGWYKAIRTIGSIYGVYLKEDSDAEPGTYANVLNGEIEVVNYALFGRYSEDREQVNTIRNKKLMNFLRYY